jgi:RimJ/RimL family protein N-acetyltransferase
LQLVSQDPGTLFETERLIVRPWSDDDAEHVFAIYRDPEVWRYLGGGKPLEDLDGAGAMLRHWIARSEEMAPCGTWAVVERESGVPIGSTMLWPLENGPEVEVGYHFAQSAWGKGYATEATRATIDHGFRVLDRDQLVAVVFPENPASQRVLEKAGMTYRGMRETFGFDLMYYTIDRQLTARD